MTVDEIPEEVKTRILEHLSDEREWRIEERHGGYVAVFVRMENGRPVCTESELFASRAIAERKLNELRVGFLSARLEEDAKRIEEDAKKGSAK